MIRKARALWRGSGRDGNGDLSTDSGVLANTRYSFRTRFESEKGTNPEELLAAAHAGCFTMALAFRLQRAGVHPHGAQYGSSRHLLTFEQDKESFRISRSALTLRASVPNLDPDTLSRLARDAEQNCPISRVLRPASGGLGSSKQENKRLMRPLDCVAKRRLVALSK